MSVLWAGHPFLLGSSPKATQRPYIFNVPEKNASKNSRSAGFFAVFKVRRIASAERKKNRAAHCQYVQPGEMSF